MEVQEAQKGKKREAVIVKRKNGIATITMNLPEKLNALSPELVRDLIEALEDVVIDESVRVIIITGAGRSFSSGGDAKTDLEPLHKMSPTEFNSYLSEAFKMYKIIMNTEKPVIAAINGYAVGAGMDLTLCCDIRIAAEDAKMGLAFVRMGICPETSPYILPRLVGLGRAMVISLLGDTVDAKEAEQMGLVHRVVPTDKLMSSAEELAMRLANGPKSIGGIKKLINQSLEMTFDGSLEYVALLQYQLVHTKDHKEAVRAFLEKRKPVFKGK